MSVRAKTLALFFSSRLTLALALLIEDHAVVFQLKSFHVSVDLRAAFADFLFAGATGFLLVAVFCLPSKLEVLPS